MNPKGLREFQLLVLVLVGAFLSILVAMRVDVMYSDGGREGGLDRLQREVKTGINNLFGTNKQPTGGKHVDEVGSCETDECDGLCGPGTVCKDEMCVLDTRK